MALSLTEQAAAVAREVLRDRDLSDGYLRVGVRGGGCAGTSYTLDLADEPGADDELFESGGVKLLVDPKSLVFVDGTEIDYRGGREDGGFVFRNPNARRHCHCGGSFST